MRWHRRRPTPLPAEPGCDQVARVLQSYLDGELGPDDAEAVVAHLVHCERCQIEVVTVRQVIDAIRRQRPDLDPAPLERLSRFVDRLTLEGPSPSS